MGIKISRGGSAALTIVAGRALAGTLSVLMVAGLGFVAMASPSEAATVQSTFGYAGKTETFTVPEGVHALTVSMHGAEGGQGGLDANASPSAAAGGYYGVVTGKIAVTPGQVLQIAVGQKGAHGADKVPATESLRAAGGSNPLAKFAGGAGGLSGVHGYSGQGGAGGAATVVTVGTTTLVAAGAGGGGGDGQHPHLGGRAPYATFSAQPDKTSTNGQTGFDVSTVCSAPSCDGGGAGGGGGGAVGGAQGTVEFGALTETEYFGYGGHPGQNSTAGLTSVTATYQHYTDNNTDGSVTISYAGVPDAPTGLVGASRDHEVALSWVAPADAGLTPVSDYVVQWALALTPTDWHTVADGTGTATSATVTGLSDGTAYVFHVAAVNSAGSSLWSTTSASVTPVAVPDAPEITSVTPGDSSATLAFTPAASAPTFPVLSYEVRVDDGSWMSVGLATSPITVNGLTNGKSYDISLRAVSAIGDGAVTTREVAPVAKPGAPTITSVSTGPGSVTVSFTPGSDGGSPITRYDFSTDGGSTWQPASTTTSPLTIPGLADGTTFDVAVRAVSAAGPGLVSAITTVTTPGHPGAPTIDSVEAGDKSLTVVVTGGVTGGSPVTGYQYAVDGSTTWTVVNDPSGTFVIPGLENGEPHIVQVEAINEYGAGPASAVSAPATPATVPSAPSIDGSKVAGADGTLTVTFAAPANGGSTITTYQYSTDGGLTWVDTAVTGGSLVITTLSTDGTTPLVNGHEYPVEVRAVNVVGEGAASSTVLGIPQTKPSAPTGVEVTPAPSSLVVDFTPGANGGSTVTSYEYRLDGSGPWMPTGTLGTTFVTTPLSDGVPHAVEVRAVNSVGAGPATAATGTPASPPAEPTITGITRSDGTLTVTVTPGATGGSPITGWQYSTDGGATWAPIVSTNGRLVITQESDDSADLVNGTTYPVTVRATSDAGEGAASATTSVAPAGAPTQPTAVSVTPLDQSLVVSFTGHANGSPITAIEYTTNGTDWHSTGSLNSPFTIPNLQNGLKYDVQVRADNAIGTGTASDVVHATPRTVPDAPSSVTATAGEGTATVSWSLPASNGGAAVTGYVATAYSAAGAVIASCPTTLTTSCTIPTLTNATTYYVSVTATNAAGTGEASSPRVSVTPMAKPTAPTGLTFAPGDTFVTVSFAPPANAGSSPVTGYEYSLNGGTTWTPATATTSPITISGLTNGTTYPVIVHAVSAAGAGVASAVVPVTPRAAPDAPAASSIFADERPNSIVVSWDAPANNGSQISGYTATAWSAATEGTRVSTCTSTTLTTCTIAGLAATTSYYLTVEATNAAGTSRRSDPRVVARTRSTPGAVRSLTGIAGNGQVALSWLAGSQGGAATVTDYDVYFSATGSAPWTQFTDGVSPLLSATVTGLTNGTQYTFRVVPKVNSTAGAEAISGPVTPAAKPGAPTVTSVTAGNASVTLDWTAPGSNGGAAVTAYVITPSSGAPITVGNVTSYQVTGLRNGTTYTFAVAAHNVMGDGDNSAASSSVIPMTEPAQPSNVTAVAHDGSVDLSWSTPADNGGSAITGYVITSAGLADISVGAVTSKTVTGLTNGTAYAFQVAAINNVGTGTFSTATTPVTPATSPGVPAITSAVGGNHTVTLSWDEPADNGGATVTGYTVTPVGHASIDVGDVTTYTVRDLTNDAPYTFTVTATNRVGEGTASAQSETVTPAATEPAAPVIGTATPGVSSVQLTWSPPADNGGSPVTGYVITPSTGPAITLDHPVTSYTVPGLTNGTAYTFTVAAVNAVGTSVASDLSGQATPEAIVPGAPTDIHVTRGNGSAEVTWTPPVGETGLPGTGYVITVSGGQGPDRVVTVTNPAATGYVVGDLENGTPYTFTVAATNDLGPGTPTAPTAPVTPITVPSQPAVTTVVAGDGTVTVTWSPPADNGGADITSYVVTVNGQAQPPLAPATTEYKVTGLPNGAPVTVTVAARNDAGTSSTITKTVTPAGPIVEPAPANPAPVVPTPVVPTPVNPAPVDVTGTDDTETAVAVSEASFPKAKSAGAVVLAGRGLYSDAVVAVPLAKYRKAPLLLSGRRSLGASTVREIRRVLPRGRTVYLVGGPRTISSPVGRSLRRLGYKTVRYFGRDRYTTSVKVANAMKRPRTVFLVSGRDVADALVAGPAAAKVHGAVLLTNGSKLPTVVRRYIKSRKARVYIVGRPAVGSYPRATRIVGADAYATAVMVAKRFFRAPKNLAIATGPRYQDSLTSGALQARLGAPLLTSPAKALPRPTASYLKSVRRSVRHIRIVGRKGTVTKHLRAQVAVSLKR